MVYSFTIGLYIVNEYTMNVHQRCTLFRQETFKLTLKKVADKRQGMFFFFFFLSSCYGNLIWSMKRAINKFKTTVTHNGHCYHIFVQAFS